MRFFEFPAFIFSSLFLILASWGAVLYFELYYVVWWLDMAHHFFGGVWLILAFNFLFKYFGAGRQPFLTLLGLVALAGILWEFAEFILDRHILFSGYTYLAGAYEDTLSDLFFDLLGGAFGFLLIL